MWLFLIFLAVPIIEIALFIQVGGAIGLFPTLVIVVLTAVAGTWLVRSQGAQAIQRLQRSFSEFDDPGTALADGAMILFAGALLLTPGFFTDAVGFALLIPQSRAVIRRYFASRIQAAQFSSHGHHQGHGFSPRGANTQSGHGTIIDADYEDVTPAGRVDSPDAPDNRSDT